jgi:hypothetical protein
MLIFVPLQRLRCYIKAGVQMFVLAAQLFLTFGFGIRHGKMRAIRGLGQKPHTITKYGTGTGKMIYGI